MKTYEKQKNRYQLCLLLFNNNFGLKNNKRRGMTPSSLICRVRGAMPPLSGTRACRYQQSLSRSNICQDVWVQQSHAAKRLISQLEVNIRRFVAMLLLDNKDKQ